MFGDGLIFGHGVKRWIKPSRDTQPCREKPKNHFCNLTNGGLWQTPMELSLHL